MIKRIKKRIKMKIKKKGIESQANVIGNYSKTSKRFELSEGIESYEGYNDETGTPVIWHQVQPKDEVQVKNIESFILKMKKKDPDMKVFGVLLAEKN